MHFQQYLNPILSDLVRVFGPVLISYIAWFTKKHLGFMLKSKYARMAVHYAEMVYPQLVGKDKLEKASEWLVGRLKKYGIKVSDAEIRGLIEDSYTLYIHDMKNNVKPDIKKAVISWSNGKTTELLSQDEPKQQDQPEQKDQQAAPVQPEAAKDPGTVGS